VEGTQNLLNITRNSLGLWVQKGIDSVVNGDETGITDLDNLDGTPRKRRFGEQQMVMQASIPMHVSSWLAPETHLN
jgi:hypothetical protein